MSDDLISIGDIIIRAKAPEIYLTEQQIEAVRILIGEKTMNDVLKAMRDYEDNPTDANVFAKGMFSYGVAYAAGRAYMKFVDEA